MSVITQGQSLADVAIQELGSVAALFDLADANGLAITDDLHAGQLLTVPTSANGRPELASYFAARAYRVNTAADTIRAARPLPIADLSAADFSSELGVADR